MGGSSVDDYIAASLEKMTVCEQKYSDQQKHSRGEFLDTRWSNVAANNYLTLRRLMSYIYGAPILDVSRSHTTTQHSR